MSRKGEHTMNKEYVANVTEEELEQATGAGSGWIRTLTDVFLCGIPIKAILNLLM